VGEGGKITTSASDASALFYLTLGLVIGAIVLAVIHPGKAEVAPGKVAYGR
jgi:hypothetical protein